MRRIVRTTLALTLAFAGAAHAQNPRRGRLPQATTPATMDTAVLTLPEGPGQGGPRAEMLRAQIEERFGQMVQSELQLSDPQMQQVRQAIRANQDRRIALMRREQDYRRAIARQMQPGEAANADSVSRMTEAVSHLRVEKAESDDQLVKDLAFLPPVKRARLLNMMQRFEERVREIRQRSQMGNRRGMSN